MENIDLQLESGEYFLSDQKKLAKKWQEKQEKQAKKTAENKRKREAAFIPPKETPLSPLDSSKSAQDDNNDLAALTKSVKEKSKKLGKEKIVEDINTESYIAAPEKPRPKKKSKCCQTILMRMPVNQRPDQDPKPPGDAGNYLFNKMSIDMQEYLQNGKEAQQGRPENTRTPLNPSHRTRWVGGSTHVISGRPGWISQLLQSSRKCNAVIGL
ncbi:hypothetical protein ACLOJK_011097 [Asimina triloba]